MVFSQFYFFNVIVNSVKNGPVLFSASCPVIPKNFKRDTFCPVSKKCGPVLFLLFSKYFSRNQFYDFTSKQSKLSNEISLAKE